MKISKLGDLDSDYWMHDKMLDWSRGCDFQHGQSTWYYSFMGRQADRAKYNEMRKKEKRENQERRGLALR